MRKHTHHHMTDTGSEDRIDKFTSSHAGDCPSFHRSACVMDQFAGEVIRLARVAAAVHMTEAARTVAERELVSFCHIRRERRA